MKELSLRAAVAWTLALVLVLHAAPPGVLAKVKADCTNAKFATEYNGILTQMYACGNASGVAMTVPMQKKVKIVFCTKCPELLALKKSGTLPKCNVTTTLGEEIKLQSAFNKMFSACDSSTSSSSSEEDEDGSDTSGSTTPAATTKAPKTKTPKPSTAAGSATGASSNSNSSNTNQTASTSEDSSSPSVSVIAGIIAGVLAVVLAVAFFLIRRHHNRSDSGSDKLDFETGMYDISVLQAPITGQASTAPYQFSFITATTSDSRGKPSSVETPLANLWEDQVIIAARIPKDKVVATTLISRGGFGEVYQGIYNRDTVAIKTLLPETRKDIRQINAFLYEVKLMASLEHERIVKFVGVAWDSLTDLCVVTEYMEGGDLRGVLTRFEDTGHPHGFDDDKIKIALDIAHALTYLHSLRPIVLHRDLKSKNILLDSQLNAKLTDFGVSRERTDSTMTTGVGTVLWMAPEVMMGERYDDKADIFSFGVVLSELDTQRIPYDQLKESDSGRRVPDSAVLQMVSLGKLRVKFTSQDSIPEMAELGYACVAVNPKDRPTAADVLYTLHNILKGM